MNVDALYMVETVIGPTSDRLAVNQTLSLKCGGEKNIEKVLKMN